MRLSVLASCGPTPFSASTSVNRGLRISGRIAGASLDRRGPACQRPSAAIGPAPPQRLHRPLLVMREPPAREQQLASEQQQRESVKAGGWPVADLAEADAVENKNANDRLGEIIR